MGVDAEEQRPVDTGRFSVLANRLGYRQNMPFVESVLKGGPAVSRSPEGHAFTRNPRVRALGAIRVQQLRNIQQHRFTSRLAGHGTDLHSFETSLFSNSVACCGCGGFSTLTFAIRLRSISITVYLRPPSS